MNQPPDNDDAAAATAGDGDAFRRLVARHQAAVARQMGRFARDSATREELTHDVFVEAFISLRGYRGEAAFGHWLRKIAVRVGYRHWQRAERRGVERDAAVAKHRSVPTTSPDNAAEAGDWVHAVLERLPASDRLILTLLYWDGCTMVEAAERAGWTVVGAKVRAFRARRRLKRLLEETS